MPQIYVFFPIPKQPYNQLFHFFLKLNIFFIFFQKRFKAHNALLANVYDISSRKSAESGLSAERKEDFKDQQAFYL
jgi:hypothetical protein